MNSSRILRWFFQNFQMILNSDRKSRRLQFVIYVFVYLLTYLHNREKEPKYNLHWKFMKWGRPSMNYEFVKYIFLNKSIWQPDALIVHTFDKLMEIEYRFWPVAKLKWLYVLKSDNFCYLAFKVLFSVVWTN